TGLSVVYEPSGETPVVDIVLVHGLQGHPYKTWAAKASAKRKSKEVESQDGDSTSPRNSKFMRLAHRIKSRVPFPNNTEGTQTRYEEASSPANEDDAINHVAPVFWPADLLPRECPLARIMVWGYDSKITKFNWAPSNQNSLLSYGKDLLYALARERPLKRRVVFVAHSLGGIIVKETLHYSSVSSEDPHRDILLSTSAVVFLGTPHRGSQKFASYGEFVRQVAASIMRADTSTVILDALGLRSSDLERCQESFSRLWSENDFRVKTFKEGLALTGVNIAILNQKVVPDESAVLGVYREHVETLEANHRDMCRFDGANDPNYRKVSGELRHIYKSIQTIFRESANEVLDKYLSLDAYSQACLNSLRFPRMDARLATIRSPMIKTCIWLAQNETYIAWVQRKNVGTHHGLLRILGKPGSGKSTLVKSAMRRAASDPRHQKDCIAGFFFDAKGEPLERTSQGLFRSLLFQILKHDKKQLQRFVEFFAVKLLGLATNREELVTWYEEDLKEYLRSIFTQTGGPGFRTLVFIDALDECGDEDTQRDLSFYLRELAEAAEEAGAGLDICISHRHYLASDLGNCLSLTTEHFNNLDISAYVTRRLSLSDGNHNIEIIKLRDEIVKRSSGIFLWAILVVDELLKERAKGRGPVYLRQQMERVPLGLQNLFENIISGTPAEDRFTAVRLFQWATLSVHPLRIREWRQIVAFLGVFPPTSLKEWQNSADSVDTDEQLETRIRTLSRGLIEVRSVNKAGQPDGDEVDLESLDAGAGSLDPDYGETRVVQVIHESVRQFFLFQGGFKILDPIIGELAAVNGHLSIMDMCLDYVQVSELDALINARK
ncbi:hypothetical protein GQ53DRAFT_616883, partial [Thozetella sp. PMI_491]